MMKHGGMMGGMMRGRMGLGPWSESGENWSGPMCGGPCGHSGMRGFFTKEERKERLGEYIQELKKETQAAEETLSELGE